MKKLLPIVCALVLGSFVSQAQTNVTFKVDITDYLAGGGTINNIVSIAGNFTTQGGSLPDWTPSAGAMTDLGSNIWSITVNFPTPNTTDSLNFKYVSGSDWPDGDEGNEWVDPAPDCKRPSDNNNRKFLLPATGDIEYFSKWAECPAPAAVRGKVTELSASSVFPNPAQNRITVRSGSDAISSISIVSADGKVVLSQKGATTPGESVNVNISTLPVGIYRVMAYTKNTVSQKQFSVVR